ncbi:unnamed protein product [Chondrus crispus]|uniref:ATP-dependent RNA helicase n=1 Tax=Chondrus crispus TaxID=2769 RepID=R7QPZ7_CHOCR|nr:unnamed protein product [Chondrus crispus]CDF40189.1 unnamed protein product [Chondrus crispus]|eukprot:XP_005710483.1 unnamed protein product [Chondrus crispus]
MGSEGGVEGEDAGATPERPTPPEEDVNDVLMVGAETGSGKTLSYLLPYVDAVRRAPEARLKAIVLVPSRELCWQVAAFLKAYSEDAPPHVVLAGGHPPDVADMASVRVVIATPTALLNYFRFSQRPDASDKMIVVDEADMLLSGSFLRDVERILDQPGMKPFATRKNGPVRAVNRNRLLFVGATYPHWTGDRVKSIITWMRRRYPGVRAVQTEDIHKRSRRLRSRWRHLDTEEQRLDALLEVLESETGETDKVMVFSSKASTCERVREAVVTRMGEGAVRDKFGEALQLHKNVHSEDRQQNLAKYRSDEGRLLFCTDLGSRGLDLGNVTRIVEFEFATNVVVYLHRIGRTARAGASGSTDHFYDDVSKPLAEAIRERSEKEGTVVQGVFSRDRSFRRKLKKTAELKAAEEANLQSLVRPMDDVVIDEVDAEEAERFNR